MMGKSAGQQPVVITVAFWATLLESLLGLGCCITFFIFNSCAVSPGCPADNWASGTAFSFYTSYVASKSCNLSNDDPVFPTNTNSRTQQEDIFFFQVLYSVLYLAWVTSGFLLLKFTRGAWWASTWLLVTLAIVVFDLTSTSIILTDIPMEVVLDGNCDLFNQTDATKQHRNLSIVAMSLYLSRGGLVWILNVVLLGWILSLAVKMARQRTPVDLDTVQLHKDDPNSYWINRAFGEAADDDEDDFDVDEVRDKFREGGKDLPRLPPGMYRSGNTDEPSPYAQPHIHLAQPQQHQQQQQQQRGGGGGPGVRRSSSLLERIRAAGNAPVAEGGLWSYGRLPPNNGGRPLPAPPDKDVDTAFGFLNSYDTVGYSGQAGNWSFPSLERPVVVIPSKSFNAHRTSTDTRPQREDNFEEARGPFSIPRVKTILSRKTSRTSSMLSKNSDADFPSSPGAEGVQKRYFVPLKH